MEKDALVCNMLSSDCKCGVILDPPSKSDRCAFNNLNLSVEKHVIKAHKLVFYSAKS